MYRHLQQYCSHPSIYTYVNGKDESLDTRCWYARQWCRYWLALLKVALQILGRKIYKNTKKSSLYSKGLLIFIYKTPAVENHPTTGEIRELLRPRSTPTGITVYFYMSSSLIFILEILTKKFQTQLLMKTLWKIILCVLCYGI